MRRLKSSLGVLFPFRAAYRLTLEKLQVQIWEPSKVEEWLDAVVRRAST
jgi:hypothetical protein